MPRSVDTDVNVQPDGRVLFTEVDLSEGTGVAAAKENRVNWVEQGGAFIAESIGGSQGFDGTGNNRYLRLQADNESGTEGRLIVVARGNGATESGVYVGANAAGGVTPGNQPGILVDELNNSDWMQVTGKPFGIKKRICEGPFSAVVPPIILGGGITLTSQSLGIGFTTFAVFIGGFFDLNGWGSYCQFSWNFTSTFAFDITVTNVGPSTMGAASNWAAFCIHD